MKIIASQLILICFLFLNDGTYIMAQDNCLPSSQNRLVNDYIGQLSTSEVNNLEGKLVNYANATSTQIAIVIVDDLCGYDKADYTYTLAEKWRVGQKGSDNGIMIMVKPTGGTGQRHTFIAVGYGLEGVIPDATAKRIVEREMIPRFKSGDIYGGLEAATNTLMRLASGEFSAEEYNKKDTEGSWIPLILFFIIVFGMLFAKVGSTRRYARRNNIGFWTAIWLLGSTSRSRGGSYGGFRSGSGGFGGGGFGGFGGGSFGGGGAGGSW